MNRFPIRTSLVIALSCAAAFTASAQDGAPRDTLIVPIRGVTVTGSRVPEAVLRTPAALTVVGKDKITPTRQISLADGLAGVPGVFSQNRSGAQDVRITIRGYGARGSGERSNTGNMRGIRVLTDGVPLTEPDGRTSLEFIDLGNTERIEVLRSNGSVLYGNASGGVVNLRSPVFDSPFTEWSARAGEYGFHREQGVAGFLLGSGRGVLSVYNSNFDGWRRHSASTTTSVQGRFTGPLDEHTRLGMLLGFVSSLNRFPGALTQAGVDADPRQANTNFVTRDERRFNRVGRVAMTLERDVPESQALNVTAFVEPKVLERSERGSYRDFNRYHVGGSAVWRLATRLNDDVQATWTAGADEQYQDGTIQFFYLQDGARTDSILQNKREGANSAGGFVQGELRWHERWGFRLAARYDNLWYIAENRIDPSVNATKRFTQIAPKGSISRYFERNTVYASVGGGVEAPAFNEIDPPPGYGFTSFNPFLEPMISRSYEIGAKGELMNEAGAWGRVGYDAAIYWIDVRNEIVPFNNGSYFFTAGKSRRRGGELGLDWTPRNAVTLATSVNVSDNEYLQYVSTGDFGGNEIPGLPKVFIDGSVKWRPVRGLGLSGSVKHVGKYFADDANLASTKAFTLLGAGAEYAWAVTFGLLRAFVAGDNLADEEYVSSVFINGTSGQFYEPGLPRNVYGGVSISLR